MYAITLNLILSLHCIDGLTKLALMTCHHMIINPNANPICREGYGLGEKAPAVESSGIAEYLCAHPLLKAYSSTYHLFNNEYRGKCNGSKRDFSFKYHKLCDTFHRKVGFIMDSTFTYPYSSSQKDIDVREMFSNSWYSLHYSQIPNTVTELNCIPDVVLFASYLPRSLFRDSKDPCC